jgi:hypothetical protein
MPISAIDTCSEDHWREVREILSDAIEEAGFVPQLVSDADDVGIIQKRIIQNLYENPVVVCDVSGKNPNVMFELGMRLAFDRPTIIVKDDKTSYSFDTSPIEHLSYPRDLRFSRIVDFKEELVEKIKATHEKSKSDKGYTTFLKHFGTFKVVKLDTEVIPQDRIVLEELKSLRELVASIVPIRVQESERIPVGPRILCLQEAEQGVADALVEEIRISGLPVPKQTRTSNRHIHFAVDIEDGTMRKELLSLARKHAPKARWLPARPSNG